MSGRSLLLHLSMPKPTHGPLVLLMEVRHRQSRLDGDTDQAAKNPQRDVGDAKPRRRPMSPEPPRAPPPPDRAMPPRCHSGRRPVSASPPPGCRLRRRRCSPGGPRRQLLHLRRRSGGDGRKFGEHLSILARGGGEALQRQFNASQPASFPARPPSVPPIR